MTVVSDTSPITNLMQVGQLELLPELFGKIVIPSSVYDELNRLPEQHTVLQHANWLQVTKVKDRTICRIASFGGRREMNCIRISEALKC